MKRIAHIFQTLMVAALLAAALTCCSPKAAHGGFRMVTVPERITDPRERVEWLRRHFWDNLDPTDSLLFLQADTARMLDIFATYASLLGPDDTAHVAALMQRVSESKPAIGFFAMLADKVLYDPNSPLRNDELFIPVLEAQLASPLLDDAEKIAPRELLQLAVQNRPRHRANNFVYTLPDGRQSELYDSTADFVLLFFHNPGCPMCRRIAAALMSSPLIAQAVDEGRLEVLAIYPDEELGEWLGTLDEMPDSWTHGYDKGAAISRRHLYDLKAIPSLYLLDARKCVMVKDSTDPAYIESVLAAALSAS